MSTIYPLYVGSRPVTPNTDLAVHAKFSGELLARVPLADAGLIDEAIGAASGAAAELAALPAWRRRAALEHCIDRFQETRDELAQTLCLEAGKPIGDAEGEVQRLIETFRDAADLAVRGAGETFALDSSARGEGRRAMTKRVPIGPCSFIAPFNFPLNLVAHKVAPAIAAGCPFVLKPASLTPIGALQIGAILAECELPEGSFSILPCRRDGAGLFTTDERLKLLSFTGSDEVGWALKARAGKKRVVLELGGNAASVVCADWDLGDAVDRNLIGAFYQSGQSCIGVQRLFVEAERYDAFRSAFVAGAGALRAGDPEDRATTIGPMISDSEAERLHGWIEEAVARGARVLCGGGRSGALLEATVLERVPHDCDLWRREAFGPVALLEPFEDYDAVLRSVNDSEFGLQAGVFTDSIARMHAAWDRLEVGGVVIGDVPSWRVDPMPYGGVKASGIGREGARFAMEDMTELRLLIVRDRPQPRAQPRAQPSRPPSP